MLYHDPCGTLMKNQVHDTHNDNNSVVLYYARGIALHHAA